MKKIIGIVLIIAALIGGIIGGMTLGTGSDEEKGKQQQTVDFKKKEFLYSKLDRPLIIPIFKDGKAAAMLIAELWLELEPDTETVRVTQKNPRLRDELLQVFYLYASEGKFGKAILEPKIQAELRRDLTRVARQFVGEQLHAVLINDLQRQDLM